MTCQARPTRDGSRCAACNIQWDRDDEAPPCPRTVASPPTAPEPPAPFVSALPDHFLKGAR